MKLFRYLSPVTTLSLCTVASLASITTATAQITPDNSLGAESSTVNPDVINGIPSDRIDGGAIRGSNLFHSFQEFNVGAGRGAYFSNSANITNILTRVTGGNPSNILGRLGVLGNANLFLLNPKGIFFGPNASLDLGGSFFGTTADSFIFNNNFEFSATNPQAVPLLSVNIPIGLRFRENPGSITNQSMFRNANSNLVGLQVQPGNSLALVGGNINLSDGGRLTASGGSIELGGLATAGTVGLDITGNSFKLNFLTNNLLSDITISNARVQNVVFSNTTGNAGDVKITTRNLSLTDGGQVSASTYGRENAGSVIINAGNILVDGENNEGFTSAIFSQVGSNAEGDAGDIQINTNNLSLTNGGLIDASTFGRGDGGSVIINANGNISADGESNEGFTSGIFSGVAFSGIGNAGGIKIKARSLSLSNGATLSANSEGTGAAGNIEVTTAKDIRLENRALITATTTGGQGNIFLRSRDLILRRNINITTNATGTATGGNIFIDTGNLVARENSDISANSQSSFGGTILINADTIFKTPDSDITATSAFGFSFSGIILIQFIALLPDFPQNLTDLSNQIAQNPCRKGSGSSFTVNGRGGFASKPDDDFRSNETRVDLVEPVASSSNSQAIKNYQSVTHTNTKPIIPAQGWIFNSKGEVVLTAYDPTNISTAQRSSKPTAACPAF